MEEVLVQNDKVGYVCIVEICKQDIQGQNGTHPQEHLSQSNQNVQVRCNSFKFQVQFEANDHWASYKSLYHKFTPAFESCIAMDTF